MIQFYTIFLYYLNTEQKTVFLSTKSDKWKNSEYKYN